MESQSTKKEKQALLNSFYCGKEVAVEVEEDLMLDSPLNNDRAYLSEFVKYGSFVSLSILKLKFDVM